MIIGSEKEFAAVLEEWLMESLSFLCTRVGPITEVTPYTIRELSVRFPLTHHILLTELLRRKYILVEPESDYPLIFVTDTGIEAHINYLKG